MSINCLWHICLYIYVNKFLKSIHFFADGTDRKLAMIFVNKEATGPTMNESIWFSVDGTFKIVPRQGNTSNDRASQVLNILADYNGHAVLLFTIVMTSRRVQLYEKVLDFIKMKYPNFKPAQLMADYEASMRNALKSRFPSARLYGCRFHFSKAVFAKIKNVFRLGPYLRPRGNKTQQQLSNLVREYLALPLLKPEDMRGQVERIGREIKAIATTHCTRTVLRRFNRLHNYILTYWMQHHGPSNISVFGALHKTNNLHERMNGVMNGQIKQHPTLFTFMNRMRTLLFENTIAVISQVNQGKAEKYRATAAARRLVERSETVESLYRDGLKSAEGLLKEAASHYDQDQVIEIMTNLTDNDASATGLIPNTGNEANNPANQNEETNETGEDNLTILSQQSISPDNSQAEENETGTEDREREMEEDPDIRDLDSQEWPISNWTQQEEITVEAAPTEAENLNLLHPDATAEGTVFGQRNPDVNDLVIPICLLCNNAPNSQRLLINCGHSFCSDCVSREDFKECAICRQPKGETAPNHVFTMMLAWKRDATTGFGADRWEANPQQDGLRPADATLREQQAQLSEELARAMELADRMLPPGEHI